MYNTLKTAMHDYSLTLILRNTECPVCSVQKKAVTQHDGYVILNRIYWIYNEVLIILLTYS